jgi:tetratricopeptide (TPR) repeat protein
LNQSATLSQHLQAAAIERRLREKVLRQPNSAQANFAMARFLTEAKRAAEALPFAEYACKLAPQNFQYLHYCGALYMDFAQREYAAVGMLRRSVQLEPRVFLSQYHLARCYHKLGQGEKAITHFRAAMKLASSAKERSQSRAELADCLANSGETEQACRIYESLSRDADPSFSVRAYCRLASLKKAAPNSELEQKLQAFLQDPTLGEFEKEIVLLALGNIHDSAGSHDSAFSYWQQSREIAQKLASTRQRTALSNDPAELEFRSQFYTPEFVRSVAPFGHPSRAPVFIAGMPRSGTTLTEQILGALPQVAAVGEIGRWLPIERAFRKDYADASAHPRLLENAAKGELKARAEQHLNLMRTIAESDAERFVEKTPHGFVWLGYLATCFPNARFVHLIRHPADTFISTYQNQFGRYFLFAYDQVEFAKEYAFSLRMMDLWKSLYPERIATFHYESLVSEPEGEARRLLAFLGLPWDDRALRFHEGKSVVRTFSAQQVRKPIFRSSVEKWRAYESHLGPLLEELKRQGVTYEPGNVAVSANS